MDQEDIWQLLSNACYFCFLCSFLAAVSWHYWRVVILTALQTITTVAQFLLCVPLNVPTDFRGFFTGRNEDGVVDFISVVSAL